MLDMPETRPKSPRRGQMAVTVTAILIFLSATGAAAPKTVAKLEALGIGLTEAQVILHLAPVLIGAFATIVARMLAANRPGPVRAGVYTLVGMGTGFVLGMCLDLFVGLGALMTAVFGPSDLQDEHAVGWAVTVVSLGWALMLAAIAIIGTPAARALQEADGAPECEEVRPRDRRMSQEAAIGLAASGISTGALTILAQTSAQGATGAILATVAALGFLASIWTSWTMWRRCDELEQRAVLQAYTASALVVMVGVFAWALANGLGAEITFSAYALYIGFTVIQFAVAMIANVTTQMGNGPRPKGSVA